MGSEVVFLFENILILYTGQWSRERTACMEWLMMKDLV